MSSGARVRAVVLLFLLLVALPAAAQDSIAVLAVDTSALGPSAGDPVPAAEAVRKELMTTGALVLSNDETTRRLQSLGVGAGFALEAYKARLQAAEDAFAALDTERSIAILEGVLHDLASDADFSTEKQELLERSRVRSAARLMALAGPEEKGQGQTPFGTRALSHLVGALRTNPQLELSKQEHPPKMRRLLARAQDQLRTEGLGGLSVDSVPAGATVYVEGRPVGLTPLRLPESLPRGRYRVWVALEPARSVTRWVEVGEETTRLEVDLAFEGALWGKGPGLRPVRGQTITEAVASKVTGLLGVGQLVLVGFASYDDARWLYGAVYSTRSRQTVRRGAVRLSADAPTDEDIAHLASFLWRGDGMAIDPSAVPSAVLPSRSTGGVAALEKDDPALAEEEGDLVTSPLLWAGFGIGAGALVVVGGVAAGALAFLALASEEPTTGTGRFDLEVVK